MVYEDEMRPNVPPKKLADEMAIVWCKDCNMFHLAFRRAGVLLCAADVPLDDMMDAVKGAPGITILKVN
jgi:hypothetical protein